jgi:hypothetical protein
MSDSYGMDHTGATRVAEYFNVKLGKHLRRSDRRASFASGEASRYAIAAMAAREPVTCWVIDETGMLEQGKHSPGVQRQYTGSAFLGSLVGFAISVRIKR